MRTLLVVAVAMLLGCAGKPATVHVQADYEQTYAALRAVVERESHEVDPGPSVGWMSFSGGANSVVGDYLDGDLEPGCFVYITTPSKWLGMTCVEAKVSPVEPRLERGDRTIQIRLYESFLSFGRLRKTQREQRIAEILMQELSPEHASE